MVDAVKKISIILASDSPILADSLTSIFKGTKDLKLFGFSSSVEELGQLMTKFSPQVVLVDVSIKSDKFPALINQVAGQETKILVINQDLTPTQTIEALRYGVHGVIGRRTTPDLLCRCVRSVAAGDIWVGRGVTSELVQFLRVQNASNENGTPRNPDTEATQAPAPLPENRFGLTKRELQIVNALVEAQTNKDIAETCRISEFTVKHHLTNIFDKLGVYNRVELALFAIHHQLCPSGVRHPLLANEKSGT